MEVTCPSCGAVFGLEPSTGPDQVCPACMFPFQLNGGDGDGLPTAMIMEIQGEDGQMIGRMDRVQVRERIYANEFKGNERVRLAGGEWEPLGERPEFAQVLALVGVDVAGLAVARQQIKGWKKDQSADNTKGTPTDSTPASPATILPEKTISRAASLLDTRQKRLLAVLILLSLFWGIDLVWSGF